MDILRRIITAILPTIILSGCYTDFEPKIESTPVVCMNADIVNGEPIRLFLTRTWRWDEDEPDDINITDAEVLLTVNNNNPIALSYIETDSAINYPPYSKSIRFFTAENYVPAPGDNLMFEAHSEKYGDATAEVTVPQPPEIDRLNVEMVNLKNYGTTYYFDLNMQLFFTDNPQSTDYYLFDLATTPYNRDYDTGAYEYISRINVDFSREPLFSEHVSTLESIVSETSGYTIFSDRQIQGKTYPLHIYIDDVVFEHSNPKNQPEYNEYGLVITLNTISYSYYSHVLSVWEANDGIVGSLGSIGLGDLVPAGSNVSTGAGVVSARSPASVTLTLWQLIEANGAN